MTGTSTRMAKKQVELTKQQLCTCITLFCTFLCRHCTTATWECLNSRFVEDVNTWRRLPFSCPELRYSLLEFNYTKNCQHLTNWKKWSKCDNFEAAHLHFYVTFSWPSSLLLLRACLHEVGDPGLVGLVSFVFTLWGTQNKRNLPHQIGVPHSM